MNTLTEQTGPRPTGLESTLMKNRGRRGACLISLAFHRRPAPASPRPNPFTSSPSPISFPSNPLRTLELSCRSFHSSRPLFSMLCTLFSQNTRGCGSPRLGRPTTIPKTGTARRRASWHGCRPRMAYWSWVAEAICLAAGLGLRRSAAIILSSAGTKYPTTIPMAPAGRALPEVLS